MTAECRGFESHQPRAALLFSLEKYLPPSSQTHVGQGEVAHSSDEVTVVSESSELEDLDSSIPNSQQVDDEEHVHLHNIVNLQLRIEGEPIVNLMAVMLLQEAALNTEKSRSVTRIRLA